MTSGTAETILAAWVDVLTGQAGDLVSTDVVDAEAATIRDVLAG